MPKKQGHEPHHFTREDFLRSFFGSFIVSLSFIFAGALFEIAKNMTSWNIVCILLITFWMVTFEIYLLGYKYVNDRLKRPFLEFWAKRFFSITISSFISILILAFIYGLYNIVSSPAELFRVSICIFLPAATAGGAMEILKKE